MKTAPLYFVAFLWQCSASVVAGARFLRKNEEAIAVDALADANAAAYNGEIADEMLSPMNFFKNSNHPTKKRGKHSGVPRALQVENEPWPENATLLEVSFDGPMVLPDIEEGGNQISFALGPAPLAEATTYGCRVNSTTGDVWLQMTLRSSGEVQCRQPGDDGCVTFANPGDEYVVTVRAATPAEDITLECMSQAIETPMFTQLGEGPIVNLTSDDEPLVYALPVETGSGLMCEVRPLEGVFYTWYDVNLVVPFVGGAECEGIFGSNTCAIQSQNYTGYVLVKIETGHSEPYAGILVCASSETQDLVLGDPLPLEAGVLRSLEYVVQEDIARLECEASESATVVLTYKETGLDFFDDQPFRSPMDLLVERNRTVLVHALGSETEENNELECNLVTWDIIPLEANVPATFVFDEWETKAFEFVTTDIAPSEVYCEMSVNTSSISYTMANLGADGRREEASGSYFESDGYNSKASEEGFGPNHLGKWYVMATYQAGYPSTKGEVQVTCGYNTYDKLISGEQVEFMVKTGYGEHAGFHFEVNGPSEVTCKFTSLEPVDGTFEVFAAEDFEVEGEFLSSEWSSDVDAWCFEILDGLTETECVFSTTDPTDAVIIVENNGDTNATDLSIVCTATPSEETAVQRTNDLFD